MNVTQTISPCHRPSRNHASPFGTGVLIAVFGPGAQPARSRTKRATRMKENALRTTNPPVRKVLILYLFAQVKSRLSRSRFLLAVLVNLQIEREPSPNPTSLANVPVLAVSLEGFCM